MNKLIVGPRAKRDINEILEYFAGYTEVGLVNWLDGLDHTLQLIQDFPLLGTKQVYINHELKDMRMIPVIGFGKYIIYYRVLKQSVRVDRVLHGAQDRRNLSST